MPAKTAPQPAAETALPEADALKLLAGLFDFNATSRRAESGPYADQMPKPQRCNQAMPGHACNLAVKKGKIRCDFHEAVGQFAATGFEAADIYENAPAEAEIRARLATLQSAPK